MRGMLGWCVAIAVCGGIAAQEIELGVMSYNLRYGTALDGENAWPNRKEILLRSIEAYDPDIIGTQETLDFQAEYLVQTLKGGYRRLGIDRDANTRGEAVTVLYRHSLLLPVEYGNFWLSETPEAPASKSWDSSLTRMVTWIRFYHLPTKRFFLFYNTHFDHRGEEARRQSAALMCRDAATRQAGLPIVVTGDFNARAENSAAWTTFIEHGFQDAWLLAKERVGPPITWSAFGPPADEDRRIDWILVKGDAEVPVCETVLYNEEGRYPSDHYAVHARIRLR